MSKEGDRSLNGSDSANANTVRSCDGLLQSALGLVGVEAVELWVVDRNSEPQRVSAVYRGLRRSAKPPQPIAGIRDLAKETARQGNVAVRGPFALHYSVAIPFRLSERPCVLVLLSFGRLDPGSETVLRTIELITHLDESFCDRS